MTPMKAYACINKNKTERMMSSSGGIYVLLAKEIIKNGGSVFSACYKDLHVEHIEISKEEDIYQTCGAKYVVSNISKCFILIGERLNSGKTVMFVGTPCECASVLKKYGNNELLLCVDVVCHGVPNTEYWEKYIASLKNNGISITDINMRNKITGWSRYKYSWRIKDNKGKSLFQRWNENPYMAAFVNDIILMPSCYECRFKGLDRQGDLTLGDFWGVWDIMPQFDDDKGVSLVFINSPKGELLFKRISRKIKSKEITGDRFLKYNSSISETAQRPDCYDLFHKRLKAGEDIQDLMIEYTHLKKENKNGFIALPKYFITVIKLRLKFYRRKFMN